MERPTVAVLTFVLIGDWFGQTHLNQSVGHKFNVTICCVNLQITQMNLTRLNRLECEFASNVLLFDFR